MEKFGNNLTAPSQCLKITKEVKSEHNESSKEVEFEDKTGNNSNNRIIVLIASFLFKVGLLFKIF